MREYRFDDQDYIVRLTSQLFGNDTIKQLREKEFNSHQLFEQVEFFLKPKVGKMNSMTLGKIIEFAWPKDFTAPLSGAVGQFIRLTGLEDVRADFSAKRDGRCLLEEMALATIVCVLYDIIHQDEYQQEAKYQFDDENNFDLAMARYIHGGS